MVCLNAIYQFVVDKFFYLMLFRVPNMCFKFLDFKIQILEFLNEHGLTKVTVVDTMNKFVVDKSFNYWSNLESQIVGAESDQLVNICSFAVRCDWRWPNTQWQRVYTGSDNVPYVQFGSVGDFIPEPRCSKSAVGLQNGKEKDGAYERPGWVRPEGPRATGTPLRARCLSVCLRGCELSI